MFAYAFSINHQLHDSLKNDEQTLCKFIRKLFTPKTDERDLYLTHTHIYCRRSPFMSIDQNDFIETELNASARITTQKM